MTSFSSWHGKSLSQHIELRDDAAKLGYRFLSPSIYGPVLAPSYAAGDGRRSASGFCGRVA